jgi:uncharacterized protein YaaW (UPF0174 family)
MAKNDELDSLLNSELFDDEDWGFLRGTIDESVAAEIVRPRRATRMNEYVRHDCYGHSVANVFRDVWSPDYKEIVRAVAKKLKIKVYDHHSVDDLEGRILQEILEAAKAKFIKEKGEAEWQRVEREAQEEMEKLASEGKIPQADILELKGMGPGGVMALIVAGRLSGIAVYLWANRIFFAISRTLGLGIGVAVAGPVIGRVLSFLLGPAGWILTGVWLVYEIGNTNWRKTISAVVAVALLRRRLRWKESQVPVSA